MNNLYENKIIEIMSVLYELSLSIGQSLELKENCDLFLTKLMKRKELTYSALWIKNSVLDNKLEQGMKLLYSNPEFFSQEQQNDELLFELLTNKEFKIINSRQIVFKKIADKNITSGQYLLLALKDFGVLKLYSEAETKEIFSEYELMQLREVIAKFAVSIKACLAHQSLKNKIKEVKLANKAKNEFLANMSHEIRTPLNAVIGFSEILAREIQSDSHLDYLNSIKVASNSLLNIINDILDLSMIEAGMLKIKQDYFNLNTLLEEMRIIFITKAENKGLQFIVEAERINLLVKLDKARLRQVLLNLINNAIKFTQKGYVKLVANVNGEESNNLNLKLEIEDTGIGISKVAQKKIFDSFTQEDGQSTREYEGVGLGLTISEKLVNLMGGKIDLESEKDEGSKFKIVFDNLDFKKIPTLEDVSIDKKKELFQAEIDNSNLADEVINKLKEVFLTEAKELEGGILINQAEEFAINLLEFAQEKNNKILIDYANQLKKDLDEFDLDNLEKTINSFIDFINRLEKK